MPSHKLTFLGHAAKKKIQQYILRNQQLHREVHRDGDRLTSRRLAYADGVVAISGQAGIELALDLYTLDLNDAGLMARFRKMLKSHGYQQQLLRPADVCAEGHLWMTLTGLYLRNYSEADQQPRHLHRHPQRLHAWVYQVDRKNRPKEDSPCLNCQQWVREEFRTFNGI